MYGLLNSYNNGWKDKIIQPPGWRDRSWRLEKRGDSSSWMDGLLQEQGIVKHVRYCDYCTVQDSGGPNGPLQSRYTIARCQPPSLAILVPSKASIIASDVLSRVLYSTIL